MSSQASARPLRSLLRELSVLLLLVGLMAAVQWLAPAGEETGGPMPGAIAMALGFALLAAHLFGRVGAQLRLPLITGYLVAGVLLGPHALGLLTSEIADSLTVVTQIALGLIALTAGGELGIERVRPRLAAIGWVTLLHTVVIFAATAGAFVALWVTLRRGGVELALTRGLGDGQVLALALILGLVATATSPSSTVAVINEMRARGPLSTVTLGVTVLKDVVVILLMGVTLTAARGLVAPEASGAAGVLLEAGGEILVSLLAGAALGLGIIGYLRWVGREVAIAVLVAVFLAAEGGRLLEALIGVHPHFLVICMTAGFLVENLSAEGRTLIEGIERSTLPVYVLFFTLAGVALDMAALRLVWPLAAAYVIWRALLVAGTTWVGCRLAGEPKPVRRLSWAGFLAQAGVTLGLAELVAQRYPEMGVRIRALILAVIAINQLLGPVLFKWALLRSREAQSSQTF